MCYIEEPTNELSGLCVVTVNNSSFVVVVEEVMWFMRMPEPIPDLLERDLSDVLLPVLSQVLCDLLDNIFFLFFVAR